MDLSQKKCVPCEGGVPKLGPEKVQELLTQLDGWSVRDDRLQRHFRFKDFKQAMAFVNGIAEIAEQEGHHPDFKVHSWNCVDVEIWTHAIGGLSENDFILASKIERVPRETRL